MLGHHVLVQIDQQHVRVFVHGPVEAVVEGGEQALRPDLLLRDHVQLPRQHGDEAAVGVVPQDAAHLVADRVVVEGEVFHAHEAVQFDEFEDLHLLEADERDICMNL